MNIYVDLAIILFMILSIIGMLYYLLHGNLVMKPPEVQFSYANLRGTVKKMVDEHAAVDVRGLGLSKQDMQKQEQQRREEMRCLRTCCSGDLGAKEVVKEKIKMYLLRQGINEETILYAIPFHRPSKMSGRELTESLIYINDKGNDIGFITLYDLCKSRIEKFDQEGNRYYEISEADRITAVQKELI